MFEPQPGEEVHSCRGVETSFYHPYERMNLREEYGQVNNSVTSRYRSLLTNYGMPQTGASAMAFAQIVAMVHSGWAVILYCI
jgi:hypothetical protein